MYIISGCPRSGTSLTSLIFKTALGENRFLGDDFPHETKIPEPKNEYQKYLRSKQPKRDDSKEMNPDGFHEMEWSVPGISYSLKRHNDLINAKVKPLKAVKIVSQGLVNTNPHYISKIVYCLRNPRQVAKSQENLKGGFGGMGNPNMNGRELKHHGPEMFIQVTTMAAHWIMKNSDIPMIIIDFDDIQNFPEMTISRIEHFIGEGDWSKCAELVKPSLNRSKPEDIEHELWPLADDIYKLASLGSWHGIIDRVKQAREEANSKPEEKPKQVMCTRLGRQASDVECEMCKTHDGTRHNFKKHSRADWKNEPCLRDVLEANISVEDSIKTNTWDDESKGLGDTVEKIFKATGVSKLTGSKDCKGCKKRKEFLNKLLPYKDNV